MTILMDLIDQLSSFVRRWRIKKKRQTVVIRGSCNMCGKCCRGISLYVNGRWMRSEKHFLKAKKYDPDLERFEILDKSDGLLKFSCRCLTSDGTCGDYENRPQLCRNFPSPDIYYQDGQLPGGCGFRMSTELDFEKILDQARKTENVLKATRDGD